MAYTLILGRLACLFLPLATLVSAYCPPLTEKFDDDYNRELDLFVVTSQADADELRTCETFEGELIITGSNATGPLILDGPKIIDGQLRLLLDFDTRYPLFTSVTMRNLTAVTYNVYGGDIEITATKANHRERREISHSEPQVLNLNVIDFPALESFDDLNVYGLDSIHTINLPSLERVGSIRVANSPELRIIQTPMFVEHGSVSLTDLPSMEVHPAFFEGRFLEDEAVIEISRTGLRNISFLNVKTLSHISISQNENLSLIAFPAATEVNGPGHVMIHGNNPDVRVELPVLETIVGKMILGGIGGVQFPELRRIVSYLDGDRDGFLIIGLDDDEWPQSGCTDCPPSQLTRFEAPKLSNIDGKLQFKHCPNLTTINLPALEYAHSFAMNDIAVLKLEDGISMPNLRHVGRVQIGGKDTQCDFFDELYCTHRVTRNYSCGSLDYWSEPYESKVWPSEPPSCMPKDVLPPADALPQRKKTDDSNTGSWSSKLVLADCGWALGAYCTPDGRSISFTLLLLAIGAAMVVYAVRRCWRRTHLTMTIPRIEKKNKEVKE